MLFTSDAFLFFFLPITLILYHIIRIYASGHEIAFLAVSSLYFYSWHDPKWLILLLFSITFNLLIAKKLYKNPSQSILFVGVVTNLLIIGWFKYRYFIIENITSEYDHLIFSELIIPLAISFFTFQQIAFLVDVNDRRAIPLSIKEHFFFIAFFPQLIAGPIVLSHEIRSQLELLKKNPKLFTNLKTFSLGVFIFSIGLFKKSILADGISTYVDRGFSIAENISLLEAWLATIAYSLQLYFDFAGYSAMAVGLALMFGFRLPVNFDVPYRATSMIEFWKRWHITVTRFFMLYVFAPLALKISRAVSTSSSKMGLNFICAFLFPIFIAFTLSGLWHGADWTFVIFGLINAIALGINHIWRKVTPIKLNAFIGWILTIFSVMVSFIFFRSNSCEQALMILTAMFNLNLFILPNWLSYLAEYLNLEWKTLELFSTGTYTLRMVLWTFILAILSITIPNITKKSFKINATWTSAIIIAIALAFGSSRLGIPQAFIYFQF